jgi:hypothetical protein
VDYQLGLDDGVVTRTHHAYLYGFAMIIKVFFFS